MATFFTKDNNFRANDELQKIGTLRNWGHFMNFGALYFTRETYRTNEFATYFVLAKRGNIMVTNTRSIRDTFCRMYGFFRLQPECFKWVVSHRGKQLNLARWFGWTTGSDVYVQLDRATTVFSSGGFFYAVHSRYIAYKFLYFIGCDVAFIFSSFCDNDHYLDFRDKGIPTIGFDDGDVNAYTYGLPGGVAATTLLIYARVLVTLLAEIRIGHRFWHLQANKFIV